MLKHENKAEPSLINEGRDIRFVKSLLDIFEKALDIVLLPYFSLALQLNCVICRILPRSLVFWAPTSGFLSISAPKLRQRGDIVD